MLTARTILPLALLATMASAHAQFGTMTHSGATPGTLMAGTRFANVAMGQNSRAEAAGIYHFYDEATLRNHWHTFGLTGPLPAKIDWVNDQVVLIHLGARATGGYGLHVGGVQKQADGIARITAVEVTPLQGAVLTQAATSPYLAISIERSIRGFALAWTKRPFGNIQGQLPAGSQVLVHPGSTTIILPLAGEWFPYGGDYYSLCESPGEYWIESDEDLRRYGQRYLNDPAALPVGFDWRTERLLAIHLGPREAPVAIDATGFQRRGTQALLTLAERPVRNVQSRRAPISPFLLVRVARGVKTVKVAWPKKAR